MFQGKFLDLKGTRVYYVAEGEGEPVVLLHGGLGSVEDFARQIPSLARQFRVVAFERTGNGHTPDNGEEFTFRSIVEQTVSFIEALGLAPVNLVGWSDGAIVALLTAISKPDLVKRVVSIGGLTETMAQSAQSRKWIESAGPESFPQAVVKRYEDSSPDGPSHFPVVLEKTKKMWLTEPHMTKEDLVKIRAPTLVMAADNEDIPLEHTLEIFRAIEAAQLCVVPGATHFLMSEKPEIVNDFLMSFLTRPMRTE